MLKSFKLYPLLTFSIASFTHSYFSYICYMPNYLILLDLITPFMFVTTTTDHKEGEQLEDRRNVGESSCNFGDGKDQRVKFSTFMMMMMMMMFVTILKTPQCAFFPSACYFLFPRFTCSPQHLFLKLKCRSYAK